jgi:hypothetical protein
MKVADRERPEQIKATAEEARIRHLLGVDSWKEARRDEADLRKARKRVSDPLLGCALGRVFYTKQISRDQHEAGAYFALVWTNWARVTGTPSPNLKAIDYSAVSGGLSTHPEESEGWRRDVLRRWQEVQSALFNANGDMGRTSGDIYAILKRTLLEDIGPLNADELGNLRVGLNAINKARA